MNNTIKHRKMTASELFEMLARCNLELVSSSLEYALASLDEALLQKGNHNLEHNLNRFNEICIGTPTLKKFQRKDGSEDWCLSGKDSPVSTCRLWIFAAPIVS